MSTLDDEFAVLNRDIGDCRRCDGMNRAGITGSAPGCGDRAAPVVIVGQSLCHRCMLTGIPFTGGSERFIKAALHAAGGRVKKDVFITNVVHCHPHRKPRDNRPSRTEEIANCREYLYRELDFVAPRLVIGLGRDERAHDVFRAKYPDVMPLEWRPGEAPMAPAGDPAVVFFPHPAWVAFQPAPVREEWVADLATVIGWGFG